LFTGRINKTVLQPTAFRKPPVERRMMSVSATRHFEHQRIVTKVERAKPAHPPFRLRMIRIPARAFMLRQNIPQTMKLPMLTE
jgi:hypothetical protein